MNRYLPPLSRVLALAAFAVLAFPPVAAADPVVVRNGSALSGEASVRQGATLFDSFYATWDDTPLPESGFGSFSDGLTLTAAGAVLTPASYITTNLSSTEFSAMGRTSAAIQVSGSFDPASRLNAFAISQLVIEFTLEEAHTFTYTGHYIGSAEHVSSEDLTFSHHMGGSLHRVIEIAPNTTASISYFNDSLFSTLLGEEFTTYSGTLEPGRYFLLARSSVRLDTANTSDSSGYAVDLVLAPVPEPATMLFVGTGLAGVLGCARRARRRKSSIS